MDRLENEKFIDEDVYRNPGLVEVASNYARNYSGNFDFMRQARRQAHREGILPAQMARAVLNCMLAAGEQIVMEEASVEVKPNLHIVKAAPEKPRTAHQLYPFQVNHKLRVKFLFSTNRQAYRAHLINYSMMLYYPARHELRLDVRTFCASNLSNHYVSLSAKVPDGYTTCPTCTRIKQEKEEEVTE